METSQATKLKKGVKRLSLICGGLGAAIWGFLCFMEIIHFRVITNPWGAQNAWDGSEVKIIMGFLFSFFLPWGILRAIPWVMEGFKEADFKEADVTHSPTTTEQKRMKDSVDNPTCPICNSNLVKATIEQGGSGDWCNTCNKSLQKMQEEGIKEKEGQETNQATNNEDSPTEAFPAFGDRLDATEKKLKKMQYWNLFIVCLLIFCITITLNLLISSKQSKNKVLMAEGLIINDKFGITRIEINTNYKSNKPYINFINDKGKSVSFIDETGHWPMKEVFDPPKTQVMPTYEELMKQAESEKLRKSVVPKPDKFIADPQKKKLPTWKETLPIK